MLDTFEQLSFIYSQSPLLFTTTIFIIALLIGSFLNVVIHRLPIMMEKEYFCECRELLADELKENKEVKKAQSEEENYNLFVPNSTCPSCDTPIKLWHNIPVISWLLLKGQCAKCANPISIRYPAVELLTGLSCAYAAWHFGFGLAALAGIIFTCFLIAMTFIDLDKMWLPDQLTLPLLWLGLIFNSASTFVSLEDAVYGAIIGYLSLWSIFWLFKYATGKEGMGYGDFKLLAALGAWMGYQALLPIILLSSFVGAILGIIIIKLQHDGESKPIPFGPYLAIAGWISFYWQEDLVQFYIQTVMG